MYKFTKYLAIADHNLFRIQVKNQYIGLNF